MDRLRLLARVSGETGYQSPKISRGEDAAGAIRRGLAIANHVEARRAVMSFPSRGSPRRCDHVEAPASGTTRRRGAGGYAVEGGEARGGGMAEGRLLTAAGAAVAAGESATHRRRSTEITLATRESACDRTSGRYPDGGRSRTYLGARRSSASVRR